MSKSGYCRHCGDYYVPELPTHYVEDNDGHERCPGSGEPADDE